MGCQCKEVGISLKFSLSPLSLGGKSRNSSHYHLLQTPILRLFRQSIRFTPLFFHKLQFSMFPPLYSQTRITVPLTLNLPNAAYSQTKCTTSNPAAPGEHPPSTATAVRGSQQHPLRCRGSDWLVHSNGRVRRPGSHSARAGRPTARACLDRMCSLTCLSVERLLVADTVYQLVQESPYQFLHPVRS